MCINMPATATTTSSGLNSLHHQLASTSASMPSDSSSSTSRPFLPPPPPLPLPSSSESREDETEANEERVKVFADEDDERDGPSGPLDKEKEQVDLSAVKSSLITEDEQVRLKLLVVLVH